MLPFFRSLALAAVAAVFTLPAAAQQYPSKPVRVIVPFARANPEMLPYTLTGLGGFTHVGTEWFAGMAKIKTKHVPYKSTATRD